MTKIYITSADLVHERLNEILSETLGGYEIEKNAFGKPYVQGNLIFFNLSHSKKTGVFALSDKNVGVDCEDVCGRKHEPLLNRFCDSERAEIFCEEDFLEHFTAREAYVKTLGGSLFKVYNALSYHGGEMYANGIKIDLKIKTFRLGGAVISVCGGDGDIQIIDERSGV